MLLEDLEGWNGAGGREIQEEGDMCYTFYGFNKCSHSSTLAWKIPWTEEPGRLQSTGLRRVGQD